MDAAGLTVAAGYVELHLHTNYSLLEGASHPEELVTRAAELGHTHLAVTDHDNLYGAMVFAHRCREAGIRPLTGMEVTIAADTSPERHHLTLLAETREGYSHLCRLASIAHGHALTSLRAQARRRRDPWISPADLREHTGGLICLTGCRQGELARRVEDGELAAAEAVLRRWLDWFGAGNVYVELMDNLVRGDRPRNRRLAALAARVGAGIVATGDVHYHDRSRHRLQDALVAIRHRRSLAESHAVRRPNRCFELRSPEQQARRFAEWPEAVVATREIAERCEAFDLTHDLGYRLPSPAVPDGRTPDTQLRALCEEAIARRYPAEEIPPARARLEEELELISRHGLSGFFLIYNEVMRLADEVALELRDGHPRAQSNLPPGRGRGSSVSSIVCYLIGLSHIDPVRNRLFLGRFLNDSMSGWPDIDLDFPRDIRARLFERVYERWGRDHAAIVGLFPTYRVRSAVRDLGRALALPAREIDRLATLAEGYGSARSVRLEMERSPQFASLVDAPGWRDLIELAHQLAGFPRHMSQHVGGMVISSDPLVDCVPIEPAAWPGRYVCHWDKDSVDDARMVKIDFLGLGMLSLVEDCVDLVAAHRDVTVDLSRIDVTDTRVYDRICTGDTIGVFQIESRAQAGMLPQTRPRSLEDLAVQVAIVRPGPIVGGGLSAFRNERRRQRENPDSPIEVPHELLRPILEETFGVVLYQEQVVQVASAMGGFTAGEAEGFRRAMGRRDWPRVRDGYRERFIAGAAARGVEPAVIDRVLASLEGFAEFGFPKSHAVAFGLLAYQSAWLKEYFPAEFYCALLNQWPMGFYPPHVVTNDAQRHDIAIRRPDINRSAVLCTVEGDAVRLGLTYVDAVGATLGAQVVEERTSHGDFHSLFDLAHRTGLSRSPLENLIRVGACAGFGLNRRELIWQLGLVGERAAAPRHDGVIQLQIELPTEQDQVRLRDFSAWQRMSGDYALLTLSPDAHPVGLLRPALPPGVHSAEALRDRRPGDTVDVAGLVVCRQRPHTAKGTVFLTLEDETGLINMTIPSALYERERVTVRTSPLLRCTARLEGHAGDVPLLRATAVRPLDPGQMLPQLPSHSWM